MNFIALIFVITFQAVVLSEIRKGTTVKSLCANISTQMLRDFNYALVWGTSAKHAPQVSLADTTKDIWLID